MRVVVYILKLLDSDLSQCKSPEKRNRKSICHYDMIHCHLLLFIFPGGNLKSKECFKAPMYRLITKQNQT